MKLFALHNVKLMVLAAMVACSITPMAHAQKDKDPFVQVTVALIYQISTYVTWPDTSFESDDSPIVIGVLGNDALYEEMVKLTDGRSISGHSIEVESIEQLDDAKGMHILYVDQMYVAEFLEQDPASRESEAILTVSESSKFVRDGGVLRIFLNNNKPKLAVNVDAAKRQRLKVSSKLLQLAEVIRDN